MNRAKRRWQKIKAQIVVKTGMGAKNERKGRERDGEDEWLRQIQETSWTDTKKKADKSRE